MGQFLSITPFLHLGRGLCKPTTSWSICRHSALRVQVVNLFCDDWRSFIFFHVLLHLIANLLGFYCWRLLKISYTNLVCWMVSRKERYLQRPSDPSWCITFYNYVCTKNAVQKDEKKWHCTGRCSFLLTLHVVQEKSLSGNNLCADKVHKYIKYINHCEEIIIHILILPALGFAEFPPFSIDPQDVKDIAYQQHTVVKIKFSFHEFENVFDTSSTSSSSSFSSSLFSEEPPIRTPVTCCVLVASSSLDSWFSL